MMDLDTPSEMLLSPSISLSTSHSSSTSDVFSLLLNQVQQCHIQQVTELEQKIVHLKKKCQKLMNFVKERGEIAVKYRQKYHQLQEENRNLKKLIKRKHYGISTANKLSLSFQHPMGAEVQQEPLKQAEENTKNSWTSDINTTLPESSKERNQSRITDINIGTPDGSKKNRLALRKRNNKKVRYREVNPNLERNQKADKENGSNSPPEERLFVPETMDPDLYEVDDDVANGDDVVIVEDNVAADTTIERSKVILRNSSTPLLVAHVSPSGHNDFIDGGETAAMSPIGRSPNLQREEINKENQLPDDVGLDDHSDSLKMSPTFTGDKILGKCTSPPGLVEEPAVYKQGILSNTRTLDHTTESEASLLLLPQDKSTTSPTQNYEKNLPQSKRKSSPMESKGKRFRTSPASDRKCGIVKYVTFSPDTNHLEEQKKLLRQSTLSQLMIPRRKESKQRTEVKIIEKDFKVPEIPDSANKRKHSLSTERERITELRKNDETNISLSLIDPIIDLDDFERDSEPHTIDSQNSLPGHSGERQGQHDGENAESVLSAESKTDKDKSDLMFDDSFDYKTEVDVEKKMTEEEEDQEDICEIVEDFDRVPRKEGSPQFKHKEVVRKHNEREKLKGFECKQCAEFYNGMQLTDTQKEERMTACSRHRGRYTPPSTPEHYWSIDFPDTPTCLQRGYIQQDDNIKVDTNAMPRRRNRLKQLFPTKAS